LPFILLTTVATSLFLFFFSSRRRHTRFSRDWSSDVCSSDLEIPQRGDGEQREEDLDDADGDVHAQHSGRARPQERERPACAGLRSEERRVGKECRSRRTPHRKKNTTNDI